MSYSVVSLFSGCGGLDYGFHSQDFSLSYVADNDLAAVKCFTYNFNFPAKKVDVTSAEFSNDIEQIGSADVVLGGFPCQGFSKAGPKIKDDPRNILYTSMLFAVSKLKPKVFIAENVDGMAQNFKGEFVKTIIRDFQSIGYHVEFKILNAVDFGVPQYRRRIIFVGVLGQHTNIICWPKPTHKGVNRNGEFKTSPSNGGQLSLLEEVNGIVKASTISTPVTISDAISDLTDKPFGAMEDHLILERITPKDWSIMNHIGLGQKLCNVRFSPTSIYTWQIPQVFGEVSKREIRILEIIGKNRRKKIYGDIPNGNPLSLETISQLLGEEVTQEDITLLESKGYLKELNGKYDLKGAMFCSGLYKKPNWHEPSPTVITLFGNPRYFIHSVRNRPFSVRECARLQSFPDNFYFLKSGISIQDAYRLIGNAVPPLLGMKIAEMARNILQTIDSDENKKLRPKLRNAALRIR